MSANINKMSTEKQKEFKVFQKELEELDTYELTDENKTLISSDKYEKFRNETMKNIPALSDEKLANYFIAIEQIVLIKYMFMNLTEEEQHQMTALEYRLFGKYVIQLHKLREDTIMKAVYGLFVHEIGERKIQKIVQKRIDVLTKIFSSPLHLFGYLIDKMNQDADIPIWIDVDKKDGTDIEVHLLLSRTVKPDNNLGNNGEFIQHLIEQMLQ